jgi:hypothetical protein
VGDLLSLDTDIHRCAFTLAEVCGQVFLDTPSLTGDLDADLGAVGDVSCGPATRLSYGIAGAQVFSMKGALWDE